MGYKLCIECDQTAASQKLQEGPHECVEGRRDRKTPSISARTKEYWLFEALRTTLDERIVSAQQVSTDAVQELLKENLSSQRTLELAHTLGYQVSIGNFISHFFITVLVATF